MTSDDPGEASVQPSSLTFTPSNWDAEQTVTITGVDDDIDDDTQRFTITLAVDESQSDAGYHNFNDLTVTGSNTDDDTAGLMSPGVSDLD